MNKKTYWMGALSMLVLLLILLVPAALSGKGLGEIQYAVVMMSSAAMFLCAVKIIFIAWQHNIQEHAVVERLRNPYRRR